MLFIMGLFFQKTIKWCVNSIVLGIVAVFKIFFLLCANKSFKTVSTDYINGGF